MPVVDPEPQEKNGDPGEDARKDIRQELEAGAAGAEELKARIAALEREVSIRDEDIGALKRSLELTRQELEGARAAYAFAVEEYKRLACEHNPLVPAEVIAGDTVDEVKASIRRANDLVSKVKEAIAGQAKEVQVPAGAPPRQEPDLSALSPREKIAYAVRNRQAK